MINVFNLKERYAALYICLLLAMETSKLDVDIGSIEGREDEEGGGNQRLKSKSARANDALYMMA